MNVVLINVVKDGDYQYEQEIPLGLAALGAYLRGKKIETVFHQCFASRGEKQIATAAKLEGDLFGFQVNMVNFREVKEVVSHLKKERPTAKTVFGGPFLVMVAQKIMEQEPLFDFTVIGDGEETTLDLVEALRRERKDYYDIPGLVWRSGDGDVIKNTLRKGVANLDDLPFPARDFLESASRDPVDGALTESIRVISSRGCVGTCNFCAVNDLNRATRTRRWRGRSSVNVVDELERLNRDLGAKIFNFSDSSFEDPGTLGKVRSREICEEIIRREIPLSLKIYLRCDSMTSDEDVELLRLYKKAGIDVIIPGAEAGSDYELTFYEKKATSQDNIRTFSILRELDLFYVLVGFIMIGPNSTRETMLENISFLRAFNLGDNLMHIGNVLMLVPGSTLYHSLKQEGRVIESGAYWEPPKYTFADPLAQAVGSHWANVHGRFDPAKKVNALQINLGNIIARMTNPMNQEILHAMRDDYLQLQSRCNELKKEIGDLNCDYFLEILARAEAGSSQKELEQMAEEHFNVRYASYLPIYDKMYNDFLDKVAKLGFPLSGLVFRHFYSAIVVEDTKRV